MGHHNQTLPNETYFTSRFLRLKAEVSSLPKGDEKKQLDYVLSEMYKLFTLKVTEDKCVMTTELSNQSIDIRLESAMSSAGDSPTKRQIDYFSRLVIQLHQQAHADNKVNPGSVDLVQQFQGKLHVAIQSLTRVSSGQSLSVASVSSVSDQQETLEQYSHLLNILPIEVSAPLIQDLYGRYPQSDRQDLVGYIRQLPADAWLPFVYAFLQLRVPGPSAQEGKLADEQKLEVQRQLKKHQEFATALGKKFKDDLYAFLASTAQQATKTEGIKQVETVGASQGSVAVELTALKAFYLDAMRNEGTLAYHFFHARRGISHPTISKGVLKKIHDDYRAMKYAGLDNLERFFCAIDERVDVLKQRETPAWMMAGDAPMLAATYEFEPLTKLRLIGELLKWLSNSGYDSSLQYLLGSAKNAVDFLHCGEEDLFRLFDQIGGQLIHTFLLHIDSMAVSEPDSNVLKNNQRLIRGLAFYFKPLLLPYLKSLSDEEMVAFGQCVFDEDTRQTAAREFYETARGGHQPTKRSGEMKALYQAFQLSGEPLDVRIKKKIEMLRRNQDRVVIATARKEAFVPSLANIHASEISDLQQALGLYQWLTDPSERAAGKGLAQELADFVQRQESKAVVSGLIAMVLCLYNQSYGSVQLIKPAASYPSVSELSEDQQVEASAVVEGVPVNYVFVKEELDKKQQGKAAAVALAEQERSPSKKMEEGDKQPDLFKEIEGGEDVLPYPESRDKEAAPSVSKSAVQALGQEDQVTEEKREVQVPPPSYAESMAEGRKESIPPAPQLDDQARQEHVRAQRAIEYQQRVHVYNILSGHVKRFVEAHKTTPMPPAETLLAQRYELIIKRFNRLAGDVEAHGIERVDVLQFCREHNESLQALKAWVVKVEAQAAKAASRPVVNSGNRESGRTPPSLLFAAPTRRETASQESSASPQRKPEEACGMFA